MICKDFHYISPCFYTCSELLKKLSVNYEIHVINYLNMIKKQFNLVLIFLIYHRIIQTSVIKLELAVEVILICLSK